MACRISVTITSTGEQGETLRTASTIKKAAFGAATGHIQQLTAAIVRLEEFGVIDSALIMISPVDEEVE